MSKGLFHCSLCKAHFYDAEATKMHIRDKHKGKGEVLRHATKRELLIRDEQQRRRIGALESKMAQAEADRAKVLSEAASRACEWVNGEARPIGIGIYNYVLKGNGE